MSWPAWAAEQVRIVPYDPTWPAQAEAIAAQVVTVADVAVEHVGSTAVPGLAAKPVLDLMAGIPPADDAAAALAAALGWQLVPADLDGRPYRRLLVLVSGGHRAAHLHLMVAGGERWLEQLAFRDALRADDGLRDEYADLKRRLAAGTTDREEYSEGKSAFVRRVLACGLTPHVETDVPGRCRPSP